MQNKHFLRIQYPFLRKIFSQLETEGNFLKLVKNIPQKCTANNILNAERLNAVSSKIRNKTRYPS